ncbi:hypothetical protein [Streptomyces alkaliphilus]|nr:hypothetical protein [Streptomyces alkaliphilus]
MDEPSGFLSRLLLVRAVVPMRSSRRDLASGKAGVPGEAWPGDAPA